MTWIFWSLIVLAIYAGTVVAIIVWIHLTARREPRKVSTLLPYATPPSPDPWALDLDSGEEHSIPPPGVIRISDRRDHAT